MNFRGFFLLPVESCGGGVKKYNSCQKKERKKVGRWFLGGEKVEEKWRKKICKIYANVCKINI